MLHKKRITFTVIRFFVVSHREIRTPSRHCQAVTGGVIRVVPQWGIRHQAKTR